MSTSVPKRKLEDRKGRRKTESLQGKKHDYPPPSDPEGTRGDARNQQRKCQATAERKEGALGGGGGIGANVTEAPRLGTTVNQKRKGKLTQEGELGDY